MLARNPAADDRQQATKIIGQHVDLAVVESVDLPGERIEIGLDHSAQTAVPSKNRNADEGGAGSVQMKKSSRK